MLLADRPPRAYQRFHETVRPTLMRGHGAWNRVELARPPRLSSPAARLRGDARPWRRRRCARRGHLWRLRVGGVRQDRCAHRLRVEVERRQALSQQRAPLPGVVARRGEVFCSAGRERDVAELAQLARAPLLRSSRDRPAAFGGDEARGSRRSPPGGPAGAARPGHRAGRARRRRAARAGGRAGGRSGRVPRR